MSEYREAKMIRKSTKNRLLGLATATAMAFSWSANVLADGDEIDALEARIAQLENLVQQLLENQEPGTAVSVAETDSATVMAAAEQAAETRVVAMLAARQEADETTAKKHSYGFGGYVKTDAIYSDYSGGSVAAGNAGRDFYIPATIPVGTEGERYLDAHSKESRINFRSTHLLDNGAQLGTFVEMDFLLSGHGDERISNSYNPRLRHAFLTYDKWTFGQTWTTLFNVAALPDNLDFIGPTESTIFGRQAMVRYTNGPWQFALENPETTITPNGGGPKIIADDSHVPDVIVRYNHKGESSSFTVAGMARQLACDENVPGGVDDTTSAWAVSLSGKIDIGDKDDFRWMASTGTGMGRYIGLNAADSAVIDANGKLEAIDSTGVFGSYRHFWDDKWRSNITLGYLSVDNDSTLTGVEATRNASSFHLNLIYNPLPKLDFGVEFMYAEREEESGVDGDMTRLQFSAKYAY
jgi:hypothetical protein